VNELRRKTGVEQAVYAILLLNMLPDKAVLPGEAISQKLGTSPSYSQKLLRRLVSADLITSVPGVKGGFKLYKKPEEIRIYDIYLAIEGHQSLYSPSGILDDMLDLEEEDQCCLLTNLMDEAEDAWKTVLKRETIASLSDEIQADRFSEQVTALQELIREKMVL
jgi:Rrf2 family protein